MPPKSKNNAIDQLTDVIKRTISLPNSKAKTKMIASLINELKNLLVVPKQQAIKESEKILEQRALARDYEKQQKMGRSILKPAAAPTPADMNRARKALVVVPQFEPVIDVKARDNLEMIRGQLSKLEGQATNNPLQIQDKIYNQLALQQRDVYDKLSQSEKKLLEYQNDKEKDKIIRKSEMDYLIRNANAIVSGLKQDMHRQIEDSKQSAPKTPKKRALKTNPITTSLWHNVDNESEIVRLMGVIQRGESLPKGRRSKNATEAIKRLKEINSQQPGAPGNSTTGFNGPVAPIAPLSQTDQVLPVNQPGIENMFLNLSAEDKQKLMEGLFQQGQGKGGFLQFKKGGFVQFRKGGTKIFKNMLKIQPDLMNLNKFFVKGGKQTAARKARQDAAKHSNQMYIAPNAKELNNFVREIGKLMKGQVYLGPNGAELGNQNRRGGKKTMLRPKVASLRGGEIMPDEEAFDYELAKPELAHSEPFRLDVFKEDLPKNMPPQVRNLVEQWGDAVVFKARICRVPLNGIIQKLGNLVTFGKLERQRIKLGYEDLFHLYVEFALKKPDGKVGVFLIEKNQKAEYKVVSGGLKADAKCLNQPPTKSVTLLEVFKRAEKANGAERLWVYNLSGQNCQDFAVALLGSGNGMLTPEGRTFAMQSPAKLLPPMILSVVGKVTGLANKIKSFLQGKGVSRGGVVLEDINDEWMYQLDKFAELASKEKSDKKVRESALALGFTEDKLRHMIEVIQNLRKNLKPKVASLEGGVNTMDLMEDPIIPPLSFQFENGDFLSRNDIESLIAANVPIINPYTNMGLTERELRRFIQFCATNDLPVHDRIMDINRRPYSELLILEIWAAFVSSFHTASGNGKKKHQKGGRTLDEQLKYDYYTPAIEKLRESYDFSEGIIRNIQHDLDNYNDYKASFRPKALSGISKFFHGVWNFFKKIPVVNIFAEIGDKVQSTMDKWTDYENRSAYLSKKDLQGLINDQKQLLNYLQKGFTFMDSLGKEKYNALISNDLKNSISHRMEQNPEWAAQFKEERLSAMEQKAAKEKEQKVLFGGVKDDEMMIGRKIVLRPKPPPKPPAKVSAPGPRPRPRPKPSSRRSSTVSDHVNFRPDEDMDRAHRQREELARLGAEDAKGRRARRPSEVYSAEQMATQRAFDAHIAAQVAADDWGSDGEVDSQVGSGKKSKRKVNKKRK